VYTPHTLPLSQSLGPIDANEEFKFDLITYVAEEAAKKRDKRQKEDIGKFYYCLK